MARKNAGSWSRETDTETICLSGQIQDERFGAGLIDDLTHGDGWMGRKLFDGARQCDQLVFCNIGLVLRGGSLVPITEPQSPYAVSASLPFRSSL